MGTWDAVLANPESHNDLTFRKDHTFSSLQSSQWGHLAYQGKQEMRITLSGTWAIEEDSLVMVYDMSTLQIDIDDSRIHYSEEVAKTFPQLQQELVTMGKGSRFIKRLNQNPRTAQATNLDRSGTRLELTDEDTPPVHYQRRFEK